VAISHDEARPLSYDVIRIFDKLYACGIITGWLADKRVTNSLQFHLGMSRCPCHRQNLLELPRDRAALDRDQFDRIFFQLFTSLQRDITRRFSTINRIDRITLLRRELNVTVIRPLLIMDQRGRILRSSLTKWRILRAVVSVRSLS